MFYCDILVTMTFQFKLVSRQYFWNFQNLLEKYILLEKKVSNNEEKRRATR